jgi:hypothetical protein
VSLTEALV